MKKILILLIFLNIFFGCSQKKTSENNLLNLNQIQENIWGKIDLENWKKTPSINNRIAIEKDVIDGIAVYYIEGNDAKHKHIKLNFLNLLIIQISKLIKKNWLLLFK